MVIGGISCYKFKTLARCKVFKFTQNRYFHYITVILSTSIFLSFIPIPDKKSLDLPKSKEFVEKKIEVTQRMGFAIGGLQIVRQIC